MKIIVIIFGIIIVVLLGILIFVPSAKSPTVPTTTEPSAVISPDGKVHVVAPVENAVIASPAVILGTVTGGGWFFEASFPVKVLDGDGTVLGQGPAQAQGDWMSIGTVPFGASISFTRPNYATGTIVFAKDNPSGAPQNAESFSIPVRFK